MVTEAVFSDIDKDGDEDLLVVGEWMKIIIFENKNGIFEDNSKSLEFLKTVEAYGGL